MKRRKQDNKAAKPALDNNTVQPHAYSYIRFSTPEQSKGHSQERQTERAAAWARQNGYDLDTELTFRDLGVSAYAGRNADTGQLGAFLRAVEDGRVPQGSYLVVESLDRISRQSAHKAVNVLASIVEAGVNVVDLSDNGRVYTAETLEKDSMAFLIMVIHFIRANQESAVKGERVRRAYGAKRKHAALNGPVGKPFTRMLPAWLTWNDEAEAFEVIEDRAKIVRWVFEQSRDGRGYNSIAKELNERGVPTWGMLDRKPAAYWSYSYISKILWNRVVLGDFTPHLLETVGGKKTRQPLDTIEGYFPAIVDRELWAAVHRRLSTVQAKGRHADKPVKNLFAGLLRCSRCGGTVTRVVKPGPKKRISTGKYSAAGVPGIAILICAKANSKGGCVRHPVPYKAVEDAACARARGIVREAPRGLDAGDLGEQVHRHTVAVDALTGEVDEVVEALTDPSLSRAARASLRLELDTASRRLEEAKTALAGLLERRETLTGPWVNKRLQALQGALQGRGAAVRKGPEAYAEWLQAGNAAARQVLSHAVLDPEDGTLALYWLHAPENPQEIPVPVWTRLRPEDCR
jgi:DNA invertase Pin-like site-specific DNA recombinase